MSRKVHETGLLHLLTGSGCHAHPAALWCSLEQSLIDGTVDQWPTHGQVDIQLFRACAMKSAQYNHYLWLNCPNLCVF